MVQGWGGQWGGDWISLVDRKCSAHFGVMDAGGGIRNFTLNRVSRE